MASMVVTYRIMAFLPMFLSQNHKLGSDKVSILIHAYPHKPTGKIKEAICNHQAGCPFYLLPDVI